MAAISRRAHHTLEQSTSADRRLPLRKLESPELLEQSMMPFQAISTGCWKPSNAADASATSAKSVHRMRGSVVTSPRISGRFQWPARQA